MGRWGLFAAFTIGLALTTGACAHGSGGDSGSDAPEADAHAGESWFSSLKHNETEQDVRAAQEQLAIQRTSATLSCAAPRELAALDRQSDILDVRLVIAIARQKRDGARKAGNTKLAAQLERKVHQAKLELLEIAGQADDGSSHPE